MPFWRLRFGRGSVVHPRSNGEGLRNIQYITSMVLARHEVSYLIHYDSLLQKIRQIFYYKMRQFYYKMRQLLQNEVVLLQNATVITKCDNFITKCDSYYKMRRLLQIATVQLVIALIKALKVATKAI